MSTKALEKIDGLLGYDVPSSGKWLTAHSELRKRSGYLLIAFVGVPMTVAVCLLSQLHNLPDSSLSYSVLNAIVSLLFNFSSSALLKVFSLLVSLLGFSRGFTFSGR
jgi:hypothetical protein